MRKKSLVRRIIPWVLVAAILGGLAYLIYLLYFKPADSATTYPPEIGYYEGDEKPITIANDYLTLKMDTKTTQFVLTETASGREWYSNPPDADSDTVTYPNTSGREELYSTLFVKYTPQNVKKPVQINNYTNSISKGGYQVFKDDEETIRVVYSIGNVERQYHIPFVITLDRYAEYEEKMDSKTFKQKTIKKYVKVTPDELAKRKDRDELLAQYPSLATETMYVLNVNDNKNKRDLEQYFADAGYTLEEYEEDQLLVAKKPDTSGPVFNVTVIYRLDGPDLVVEIPYKDIRFRSDYPLTYISPLPMFNAAGPDAEGFLLIPEGGGAIIRYNNGKLSQNEYSANLYGWDYGEERKEVTSETENAFPVFGGTNGDASFICIMEGASSYGAVYADIGGIGHKNGFNTVYGEYNVIHAAQYNVSDKTAQRVYVYEKQLPDVTLRQRYRFLDSADYADMATAYGEYLRENHEQLRDAVASEEMPVNVELVGAINKNVVKAGIPVDSVVATTTFAQAKEILGELADSGIKDLSVRMTGWSNGGIRQKVLTSLKVLNELGGDKEMKPLIDEAKSRNVDLYFDGITCFAYNSGIFDGFVPQSNSARYATRDLIHLYPFNIVTFQIADWMDDFYLVKPDYAQANASNLIRGLKERNAAGIGFRDIGNLLSADYNDRELRTREQVKQMNIDTMLEAKEAELKVMIKEGNDYAVPYADRITDMNLTGQAYAIIDERIPFYQIALHGTKDYTGEPINLSGDYVTMLLECAEYGAGLNFTFMAEDTRVLKDSVYSNYTASGYSFWKDQVISMIRRYQEEMKGLNRTRITGHERIAEEVTKTTYADETKVYVNFGDEPFEADGITVPARDYAVKRGDGK